MTPTEAAALLGVSEGASIETVQHAFVRAAREHHPDRHFDGSDDDRAEAGERFRRLAEAREVLLQSRPVIPVEFQTPLTTQRPKGIGGSVVILLILAALLVLGVTLADGYRSDTVENLRGGYIQPE